MSELQGNVKVTLILKRQYDKRELSKKSSKPTSFIIYHSQTVQDSDRGLEIWDEAGHQTWDGPEKYAPNTN